MSFLYDIFNQLKTAEKTTVLRELNDQESPQQVSFGVTGKGLLMQVSQARRFLAGKGLHKGDRCALLAHTALNGLRWIWPSWPRPCSSFRCTRVQVLRT